MFQFSLKRLMLAVACLGVGLSFANLVIGPRTLSPAAFIVGAAVACYGVGAALGVLTGRWRVGLWATVFGLILVGLCMAIWLDVK